MTGQILALEEFVAGLHEPSLNVKAVSGSGALLGPSPLSALLGELVALPQEEPLTALAPQLALRHLGRERGRHLQWGK